MTPIIYEFTAYAWALPALINGDTSGIDYGETAAEDMEYIERLETAAAVARAEQGTTFGHWDCDEDTFIAVPDFARLPGTVTNLRYIVMIQD